MSAVTTFGTELSHGLVRPLVLRPRIAPGVLLSGVIFFAVLSMNLSSSVYGKYQAHARCEALHQQPESGRGDRPCRR